MEEPELWKLSDYRYFQKNIDAVVEIAKNRHPIVGLASPRTMHESEYDISMTVKARIDAAKRPVCIGVTLIFGALLALYFNNYNL